MTREKLEYIKQLYVKSFDIMAEAGEIIPTLSEDEKKDFGMWYMNFSPFSGVADQLKSGEGASILREVDKFVDNKE